VSAVACGLAVPQRLSVLWTHHGAPLTSIRVAGAALRRAQRAPRGREAAAGRRRRAGHHRCGGTDPHAPVRQRRRVRPSTRSVCTHARRHTLCTHTHRTVHHPRMAGRGVASVPPPQPCGRCDRSSRAVVTRPSIVVAVWWCPSAPKPAYSPVSKSTQLGTCAPSLQPAAESRSGIV
jgi:hypothetical protein